jgi:hypothetical protein
MTLLSQPRTARVVIIVSPESISATSEPGSAQPIWCARPPLAAFDAQGHLDRQRYRFGLGVSYRLRARFGQLSPGRVLGWTLSQVG